MYRTLFTLWAVMLAAIFFVAPGYAGTEEELPDFQGIFTSWTQAFNQKEFPRVCDLFSKSITADYQGAPRKNYSSMCDGFRKIFQEKEMRYRNSFKIHQIYHANNLAAVRVTWYLDVYKKGVRISSIQEEGMDVFQKQADGKWRIVNFIAYPIASKR